MQQQPPYAAGVGGISMVRAGDSQGVEDARLQSLVNLGRGLPDRSSSIAERELLAVVDAELSRAGCSVPHLLIVDYYVALRTHQFVILLGPQGQGKSELARIFGETLVGSRSDQVVSIQARPSRAGGEQSFFAGLYERFSWLKFVEFLERAAAPENVGKPYFLCLEDLSPLDVETYFALLIQGDRPSERRLAIPGCPPARWPILPANLFLCGTLNADERTYRFSETVLGRVGAIEFRTMALLGSDQPLRPISVPLVGLQRLILAPTPASEDEALVRLHSLLGLRRPQLLHPSDRLAGLLRATGVAFAARDLASIGRYIANCFDRQGRGLFYPEDRLRNYHFALNCQMARRALLRLRCSAPLETQALLEHYLDGLFAGAGPDDPEV